LQTRLAKKWKKHFDRQWSKLRGHRRPHQKLHNHPATPSAEALDAKERVAQLDALPVYARNRPADAPTYDATGNLIYSPGSSVPGTGFDVLNGVSQVHVRS